MARSYRVFLGAPTAKDLRGPETTYSWQTVASHEPPPPLTLPPATLAAASRRISLLYQNIIFRDSQGDDELPYAVENRTDVHYDRDSTAITWAPTPEERPDSGVGDSRSGISFLRSTAGGTSRHRSMLQTQETQETGSFDYSDASSIARFPAFHFNLHALTPLSVLVENARADLGKGSRKATVLVAVLEVEGPDTIRIKKGLDAGKEVSLLKLILGDEDGVVCKLTAWRDVADMWGGLDPDPSSIAVKKGDIILLENVLAAWEATAEQARDATPVNFTASPHLKPRMEICYRTLPSMPQDRRFRPDLRLGGSDAAVRKVAAVVSWFEGMAGLPAR